MDVQQGQSLERQHIAVNTDVCGGKPCVAGTRIRVWDIHVWHDLRGMTPQEIVAEFPQLTVADVHASLTYYHDNRELLEQQDRDAERLVEKLTARYPSQVQAQLGQDAADDSVSS